MQVAPAAAYSPTVAATSAAGLSAGTLTNTTTSARSAEVPPGLGRPAVAEVAERGADVLR